MKPRSAERLERECKRCGRCVLVTRSGHLRAHACPHGGDCVIPYHERREGKRAGKCPACTASRQLELFPETPTHARP